MRNFKKIFSIILVLAILLSLNACTVGDDLVKDKFNKEDSDKQDSDKQDSDKQDSDKPDSDKQDSDKQDSDKQDSDKQDSESNNVNSGKVPSKTNTAATINGKEVSSVVMNYYFIDYIKNTYYTLQSQYGESTSIFMGVDVNTPLDKQVYDQQAGDTWADYYLDEALTKAKSDYALYNKAMAEGFALTADEQAALDSSISMLNLYAQLYGYKHADKYLQAMYGFGSTLESYSEYIKISTIASAFYNKYSEDLKYDDAAIRAYEKDKVINFTSFSYATYTLTADSFLPQAAEGEEKAEKKTTKKTAPKKTAEKKTTEKKPAAKKTAGRKKKEEN